MTTARALQRNALKSRPHDTAGTPREFFYALDHEFGFSVDAAANADNALCKRFWTPDENGLNQDWTGEVVWCNPPYSNIAPWVAKARGERDQGATTVLLLPARTDSPWWHEQVWDIADEIRWVRGRMRFGGRLGSAPFASVVVVYRGR